jgi:integrase
VLPANGVAAYFATKPQSKEDKQDQAMAILAFFGCLRGCELTNIEHSHLELVNDGVMVTIICFKTTNKASRFLVPFILPKQEFSPARILLDYIDLVKPWLTKKNLLRIWPRPTANGFSAQFRGKNHLGKVAKKIAVFLKIDPSDFTGHSFRQTSATAAADAGISLINLKRFGGWKSDQVASGYVDSSLAAAKETAELLLPTKGSNEETEAGNKPHDIIAESGSSTINQLISFSQSNQPSGIIGQSSSKPSPFVFNFYVTNN